MNSSVVLSILGEESGNCLLCLLHNEDCVEVTCDCKSVVRERVIEKCRILMLREKGEDNTSTNIGKQNPTIIT